MTLPSLRTVLLQKAPAIVIPNLRGAWAFDENTGTTAADGSGNNLPMTLTTGMTWVAGHTNSAVSTSGSSDGANRSWAITTPITIMAWCKPTDLTINSTRFLFGIFDDVFGNGATQIAVWAQRSDFSTGNVLQGNVRVGGSLKAVNGASALPVNVWTHLALTYDGTTMALYQDGSLVTSSVQAGTISTGDFHLLVLADSGNNYGVVDDLRVYDRALIQSEIIIAMNTPVL